MADKTGSERREPYLFVPVGYYKRNGILYGPSVTVLVYKTPRTPS